MRNHKFKTLFVLLALLVTSTLRGQDITGIWVTYDDQTNEAMSHVELCIDNGKLYGKIIKVLDENNSICTKCKGDLKNAPVVGLEIINGFSKLGDRWSKKKGLLDPKSGFVVDGEIWLDKPDVLKVKGKVSFYSATQTWKRLK